MTEITLLLKRYERIVRDEKFQNIEVDPFEVQQLRDLLSINLYKLSSLEADYRMGADSAENTRKLCVTQAEEKYREEYKNKRGSASLAERKALIECQDSYRDEEAAKGQYYTIKNLVERVDQVINSISSRIKQAIKHD